MTKQTVNAHFYAHQNTIDYTNPNYDASEPIHKENVGVRSFSVLKPEIEKRAIREQSNNYLFNNRT